MAAKTRNIFKLERPAGLSPAYFGLLFILVFLPFFNGGLDHDAAYWALLLALAASLWIILKEKSALTPDLRYPFIIYGLFLLWSGASIFWSIAPHRTMVEWLQLSLYGTVMFLATRLNRNSYFRIGRIVLLAGVLLAVHGALQNIFLGTTTMTSVFHHHNTFGIYMVMLFYCAWGYYLKYGKTTVLAASIFLLTGLFISGSRGALVALLLASPLLLAVLPRERRAILSFAAKTLLCVLVAFLLATAVIQAPAVHSGDALETQLSGILGRPDYLEPHNVFARFSYWEVGVQLLRSKPLQGYGLGTFFASYVLVDSWREMHFARFAHNHYLQSFVETGLIGFLLLAGFLVSVLYVIKKTKGREKVFKEYPGAMAAVTAYLVHIGLDFSWNIPAVSMLFFVLVGLLLGCLSQTANGGNGAADPQSMIGRKILLPVALLLFFLAAWQTAASQFYYQALKSGTAGDHARALSCYEHINRFYPINARGYYFSCVTRIKLYEKSGDVVFLQGALSDAQRAVKLNPVDALLQNTLGLIYQIMGDDESARRHLFLGYRYSDRYLPRYVYAGSRYLRENRLVPAEKAARKGLSTAEFALAQAPTREDERNMTRAVADLHLILVEVFIAQEDRERAREHLRLAEEIMPDHPMLMVYKITVEVP